MAMKKDQNMSTGAAFIASSTTVSYACGNVVDAHLRWRCSDLALLLYAGSGPFHSGNMKLGMSYKKPLPRFVVLQMKIGRIVINITSNIRLEYFSGNNYFSEISD
jgi:hypothetical protein